MTDRIQELIDSKRMFPEQDSATFSEQANKLVRELMQEYGREQRNVGHAMGVDELFSRLAEINTNWSFIVTGYWLAGRLEIIAEGNDKASLLEYLGISQPISNQPESGESHQE